MRHLIGCTAVIIAAVWTASSATAAPAYYPVSALEQYYLNRGYSVDTFNEKATQETFPIYFADGYVQPLPVTKRWVRFRITDWGTHERLGGDPPLHWWRHTQHHTTVKLNLYYTNRPSFGATPVYMRQWKTDGWYGRQRRECAP